MSSKSPYFRRDKSLSIEQLEDRNMLSGTSMPDCCEMQVQTVQVVESTSAETQAEIQQLAATGVSQVARGLFFGLRLPSVQLPTTVEVGVVEDQVNLSGSNSFFDRIDRYEFSVEQAGQLDASLEFESQTLSALYIFDSNRELVAWSATDRDSQAELSTGLEAGDYVAIVYRGLGDYQLNLDFEVPQPIEDPIDGNSGGQGSVDQPVVPPVADAPPSTETSRPAALPNAPYYGSNLDWNLNAVGAPEAWNAGYRGDNVVVAVIDTGINVFHSDINDNIWTNPGEIAGDGIDNDGNGFIDDFYGWNFVANSPNVFDDNGHGTHVAGTIAAEQNGFGATGVAPDTEILSVKVLNQQGSGFVSAIANGIRYAVDSGADIINLSLGGGFSTAIASALGYAAANDVLVVAAAGNESSSVPSNPATLSSIYSNVLSVGAYDSRGNIASFSNGVGRSGAVQVDAPGVNIYGLASNGGFRTISGTSMAAPHVAGVAALTLSANPNLTADSLRNIIVSSSLQNAGGSDAIGAVNAATAIPLAFNGNLGNSSSSSNGATGNTANQSTNGQSSLAINASIATALQVTGSSIDVSTDSVPESVAPITQASSLVLAGAVDQFFSNDSWLEEVQSNDTESSEATQQTDLAFGDMDLSDSFDFVV